MRYLGNIRIDSDNWMLRTSDNGVSFGGFKRKPVGQWNKAESWTGIRSCEECGGFFGITPKYNCSGLLPRSTLELCEIRGEVVPIDGDKICVEEYRVVAVNENIPREFIEACGHIVPETGSTIQPKKGERYIIFHDTVIEDMQDGEVFIFSGRQKVIRQQGGWWEGYNHSKQEVIRQQGGYWVAYDYSEQEVIRQQGGYWEAHNYSRQEVIRQQGGYWRAFGYSKQKVIGQQDGWWKALKYSKQKIIGQQGGYWEKFDNQEGV